MGIVQERNKLLPVFFLKCTEAACLTISVSVKDFGASDQLQQMWHAGSVPKILSTCMVLKVASWMED